MNGDWGQCALVDAQRLLDYEQQQRHTNIMRARLSWFLADSTVGDCLRRLDNQTGDKWGIVVDRHPSGNKAYYLAVIKPDLVCSEMVAQIGDTIMTPFEMRAAITMFTEGVIRGKQIKQGDLNE